MKIIADFHIHSKYSRACSKDLDLPHLDYWAKVKGINIMGTGDFTHPGWFEQIGQQLEEAAPGFYKIKKEFQLKESKNWAGRLKDDTLFLLTSEISCIYSKRDKVRRIHLLVFAPSIKTAGLIRTELEKIGNLAADGRPILGLDAAKLTALVLKIDPACMIVPAHAWTPWFSVFGSKSGFNTLEECFDELTPHIYAIETGLSSDPSMNWRLSKLDSVALLSNSDAHSLPNLGREANVFDLETINYQSLVQAIKTKNPQKFIGTLEFFPEEGKYHLDGHAVCKIRLEPTETRRLKGICPVCKKPLTVGVLSRVEELADRPTGDQPKVAVPFTNIVPLAEIIAESFGKKKSTKPVLAEYSKFALNGVSEFEALLDLQAEQLSGLTERRVIEGIIKVRSGQVRVEGGYDGIYGTVRLFDGPPSLSQSKLV